MVVMPRAFDHGLMLMVKARAFILWRLTRITGEGLYNFVY